MELRSRSAALFAFALVLMCTAVWLLWSSHTQIFEADLDFVGNAPVSLYAHQSGPQSALYIVLGAALAAALLFAAGWIFVIPGRFVVRLLGRRFPGILQPRAQAIFVGLISLVVWSLAGWLLFSLNSCGRREFAGQLSIPKKAYQNTSAPIIVTLAEDWVANGSRFRGVQREGHPDSGRFRMSYDDGAPFRSIQVELVAAGVDVGGDLKQVQPIARSAMTFRWNCHFKDSGEYLFTIAFSGITNSGEVLPFGSLDQAVNVAKIDHLSENQVWILGCVVGSVSLLSTVLGILEKTRRPEKPEGGTILLP